MKAMPLAWLAGAGQGSVQLLRARTSYEVHSFRILAYSNKAHSVHIPCAIRTESMHLAGSQSNLFTLHAGVANSDIGFWNCPVTMLKID